MERAEKEAVVDDLVAARARRPAVGSARGVDLRARGVFQEPMGRVEGMASLAGLGGTAGSFGAGQERRTGTASERLGDGRMSLLRSNRVPAAFRGEAAARLFILRAVRGDRRSDGSPPR